MDNPRSRMDNPPTGVSLHFLTNFLDDNRLRRPLHKLGKPNANIEVSTIDQLRELSHTLRLFSDHVPNQEFATYNNETIKRDAWVKQLKTVPTTTTHILECVVKQQMTTFKQNNPTHQGTSFCDLVLHKHHDKGIANSYVIHAHHHRFKDLVEALSKHEDHLDEMWDVVAPRPTQYYYIDIFCQDPFHQENRDQYFRQTLVDIMQTINSVLLVVGDMKSLANIMHPTPSIRTTATTTTTTTPRGTATTQSIQPLATYTTRVLWELYTASLYVSDFQVCLQAQSLVDDAGGGLGFDLLLMSDQMNDVITTFLSAVVKPATCCVTMGGTMEQNQQDDVALQNLIASQWDGGADTVHRVVTATIKRWLVDRAFDTCTKWQLVEADGVPRVGCDGEEELTLSGVPDGSVTPVGALRKRRKSSRPSSSKSSRSTQSRARSRSRSGSRSKFKNKSRPTSPTSSKQPMHGKKNEKSEEDPVYTVMATLAKHLIEQHTHEQHQKNLGVVKTEFHRTVDQYATSNELNRALRLLQEVVDERETIFGPTHVFSREIHAQICLGLQLQGKLMESEQRLRSAVFGWLEEEDDDDDDEEKKEEEEEERQEQKQEEKETEGENAAPETDAATEMGAAETTPTTMVPEKDVRAFPSTKKSKKEQLLLGAVSTTEPRNLINLSIFGSVLADLEQNATAEEVFMSVVNGTELLKGKSSMAAFQALDQLARFYIQAGETDLARNVFQMTLEKRETYAAAPIKKGSETLVGRMCKVHDAQFELGALLNADVAEDVRQTISNGKNEDETNETNVEKTKVATALLRSSATGRKKYLGLEHRHTLQCLHELSVSLGHSFHMDEAIETIKFVVSKRDLTLGPDHIDSIRSIELHAHLLLKRLERRGDGTLEIEVVEFVERMLKNVEMDEMEEFREHQVDIDAGSFLLAFPLDASTATTAPMDDETAVELLLRRAVVGYTQLIGEDHPHLLAVLSTLGRFLRVVSDPVHGKDYDAEAEDISRKTLQGRFNVLGNSHPDTLSSINELATNLVLRNKRHNIIPIKRTKRNIEAEELYRKARTGRELILGPLHPHTMVTVNQLAAVLHTMGNKESEMILLFRRDLHYCVDLYGDQHVATIKALVNLGHSLWCRTNQKRREDVKAGDETDTSAQKKDHVVRTSESLLLLHRAWSAKKQVYGVEHQSTIRTEDHLGSLLCEVAGIQSDANIRTTRYEESEMHFRHVLETRLNAVGEYDVATMNTMSLFSAMLWQRWKIDKNEKDEHELESWMRRELSAREKVMGSTSIQTLSVVLVLAKFLRDQETFHKTNKVEEVKRVLLPSTGREIIETYCVEIEVLLLRAVEGFKTCLGHRHVTTLDAELCLSQVYVTHNKLAKGEEYARSALFSHAANRDLRRVDGSIEFLKNILTLQDRQEEADQVLVQVLKIALGAGHQRTIGAMKDLASRPWQYNCVHDGVHAAVLYEEIIASETKLLTCKDPMTLQSMKLLSTVLINRRKRPNTDDLLRALGVLKKEIHIRVQVGAGPRHVDTLDAIRRLGRLLKRLRRLKESLLCIKRVYDGFVLIYDEHSLQTLDAGYELATLYIEMGLFGEAHTLLGRLIAGYEYAMARGRIDVGKGKAKIQVLVEQIIFVLRERGDEVEAEKVRCSYFIVE